MSNNLFNEPIWLFPFDGMEVGDSFFIPTLKSSETIYSAVEAAKKHNLRVKAFAAMKDGIMGVRVWRVN
jgi:hypothetical protein